MQMSWELMSTNKKPCPCGKGFIVEENFMDDWNRTKEEHYFECDECKKKNDDLIVLVIEKDKREKMLNDEIVSYFNEHYIDQWIAYFNDKKSIKTVWKTIYNMGIESGSLSSFYSHKRFSPLYFQNLVQIQNISKIMQVLNIKDEIIERKLPEALRIYEERRINSSNEAYAHYRKRI
jgi:hypothetical protein